MLLTDIPEANSMDSLIISSNGFLEMKCKSLIKTAHQRTKHLTIHHRKGKNETLLFIHEILR